MKNLKAGAVCKTEGDSHQRIKMKKDLSELRFITTTDNSSQESPFTEPSSSDMISKDTRTKREKVSPLSTASSKASVSSKRNYKQNSKSFFPEYTSSFVQVRFLITSK